MLSICKWKFLLKSSVLIEINYEELCDEYKKLKEIINKFKIIGCVIFNFNLAQFKIIPYY